MKCNEHFYGVSYLYLFIDLFHILMTVQDKEALS